MSEPPADPASTSENTFPAYRPPGEAEAPSAEAGARATREAFRCPNCGGTQFNPGFVEDAAQGATRWFQGQVEYGLLGGVSKFGRARHVVVAYRCVGCNRLELYAGEEV